MTLSEQEIAAIKEILTDNAPDWWSTARATDLEMVAADNGVIETPPFVAKCHQFGIGKVMTTIRTVNVMEIPDRNTMSILSMNSFSDTPDGNTEAETLFKRLIKENNDGVDPPADEIEEALENGYWERDSYYACIVHSTGQQE